MKTTALQGNVRQLFYKDVGVVAGDITPAADLQQSTIKKRYTSVCMTQRFIVSCDLHRQGMSALDPSTTESVQLKALANSSDLHNYGEGCYFSVSHDVKQYA